MTATAKAVPEFSSQPETALAQPESDFFIPNPNPVGSLQEMLAREFGESVTTPGQSQALPPAESMIRGASRMVGIASLVGGYVAVGYVFSRFF